jgi:hypothetical protein
MKDHRSDFRKTYGHPNIVVSLDAANEAGSEWLLSYFEDQIRQGMKFKAGETVQIGWMIVMLKGDDRGDLEIWEPRFHSMPISWVRGAINTFRHIALQSEVCKQVGVEPDYPSLRQAGAIQPGFLDNSDGFKMDRETPEGRKSGWKFFQLQSGKFDGKYKSLFEIAIGRFAVVPFIALPSGASVTHSKSRIEISLGTSSISSDSNTFLNKLLASPIFA